MSLLQKHVSSESWNVYTPYVYSLLFHVDLFFVAELNSKVGKLNRLSSVFCFDWITNDISDMSF